MATKHYTVSVPGLLLANGSMAVHGQEITSDQIANHETRLEEGYIMLTSEFKAAREKEAEEMKLSAQSPEEKTKAKADADKQSKELKDFNDLLASYKSKFKIDAPDGVSKDALTKAIADNKAVGAQ